MARAATLRFAAGAARTLWAFLDWAAALKLRNKLLTRTAPTTTETGNDFEARVIKSDIYSVRFIEQPKALAVVFATGFPASVRSSAARNSLELTCVMSRLLSRRP